MTASTTRTAPNATASREMTGAEIVVQALIDQGVSTLFGYPGGAVLPIYDALFQDNERHGDRLRHILVRHEQGATHAAEGYARSTGKPGVVLVTSGPGATNAITGIVDALMDSIPMVVFTGQVPTHLIGTDAFQEADTVGITRACTKHNYLVKDVADLPRIIHEAFHIATTGRPGPVLIDIPKDVQFAKGEYFGPDEVASTHAYNPKTKGEAGRIAEAARLIAQARRPIFYTGGGVINSGPTASKLLREFVALTNIPITSTLMGLGAYPGSDRQFLGMLGINFLNEQRLKAQQVHFSPAKHFKNHADGQFRRVDHAISQVASKRMVREVADCVEVICLSQKSQIPNPKFKSPKSPNPKSEIQNPQI